MPVEARDPRRLHVFVGDKRKALSDRFSIVLNEDLATSLFGQGDPIGKIVTIGDLDFGGDYRVTGVVSVPKGTFGFGALISTMPQEFRGRLGNWMTVGQWRSFETYVLLAEGASTADLESKLPVFMETYMGAETRATNRYHLSATDANPPVFGTGLRDPRVWRHRSDLRLHRIGRVHPSGCVCQFHESGHRPVGRSMS